MKPRRKPRSGGRPVKGLEPFADITKPPNDDPLATALWAQQMAKRLLQAVVTGTLPHDRVTMIRQCIDLVRDGIPVERMVALEELLQREQRDLKARVSGKEPEPTASTDDGEVLRGPAPRGGHNL